MASRRFVQKQRIEGLVTEKFSGAEAHFDEESPDIKFVVRAKSSRALLTVIVHWKLDEVEKMTDSEVIARIVAMAGGRL